MVGCLFRALTAVQITRIALFIFYGLTSMVRLYGSFAISAVQCQTERLFAERK